MYGMRPIGYGSINAGKDRVFRERSASVGKFSVMSGAVS